MKNMSWQLCLMAGFVCWILHGGATPAMAADENPPGPNEHLQQLERRVNELADRQEQMMRRSGMGMERPGAMPMRGEEGMRPMRPWAQPDRSLAGALHKLGDVLHLMILVGLIFNILLAIWIFTDIRKRGEGPAIFIALALLAGIPAAIIYSLVRLGDKLSATPTKPSA